MKAGRSQSDRQAVVIGAGFGGLAASLRLRARGYRVRVIDRLDQPGGRATVYRRGGFVFDAGPTIITAPFLLEELFALFDRELSDYAELRELDTWYRIRFHDGNTFDYGSSLEDTLAEIERYEPRDVDGYRKLLEATAKTYRIGFEQLGDHSFDSLGSMVRILPQLAAVRGDRTVYRQTSRYLSNHYLRQVFSFHPLLVGGNPFATTSIYSLIHYLERNGGVHFAMGGTGALVEALCRLMEEVGIELDLGRTVETIDVSDGRVRGVRLADGEALEADVVVANADAPFVYRHMIAPEHRRRWTDRRLEKLKYSMGLFVAYFGARRTYPGLAHHEIHLGPRYRGLLDDIFEHQRLAEDFSLYLHAPTRTDPSLAPEGCESMYALVPVPNLRAEIDWEVEGPRLRDRLYEQLDRTVCPGLTDQVCEDSFVTPQHFRSNLLSMHGAGFSIQPILRQSAYFRFHNRSEDVENLFFVGAGTHPGAGIPGVLMTAKVLDRVVPAAGRGTTTSGPGAASESSTARQPRGVALSDDADRPTAAMETFRDRARTFSLASYLFPSQRRYEIATLYAFCRHVDDLADLESSSATDLRSPREALAQVRADLESGSSADPVVSRFLELAGRRDIDLRNAELLVAGAESDLDDVRMATMEELLGYCYRVASTVGLMFCDLVDVRSESARRHAVDLGIAMQLTNVARDVAEDAAMDRIYVPSELVAPEVLKRALAGEPDDALDLYAAVMTLLEEGKRRYRSGDLGLSHLPTRIRWGVLAASRNYEAIGRSISRQGPGYWHERTVVGTTSKLVRSLLAIGSWSLLGRPWSSAASEPEKIPVPELEDSRTVAGSTP